jgi:hypothetical protein
MSISRNLFDRGLRIKNFLNGKKFKTFFISFGAFFLFLGVFNVYAQENVGISPDWDGTKAFHNKISGADEDEDNMNSRQGQEALNATWTAVSLMAPEITANAEDVKISQRIPNDLKRGLIGMVDDAGDTVYAMYPMTNVTGHLAQRWVPGYNSDVTGLYAAPSLASQDSGYESLMNSGIVGLWTKMLNLSYIFFVIVMIAAGFMIMFRHKLGGQTMVTIGNVLPNVILALILATFSFAIAGLIIDIGGILVYIIADVLGGNPSGIDGLWHTFGSAFTTSNKWILGGIGGGGTAIGAGLAILGVVSNPVGWVIGLIALLPILAILGVIFVGALKVIIALYKAYFSLLLGVILAPIQITLGALPGNKHIITNWFLSILRNVLVFPVVFFIINIPDFLVSQGDDVKLGFPNKLVYGEGGADINATAGIFIFILRILVLYFAAQAPKFLEAWLPANTPKAIGEGLGAVKASLSKTAFIGGLFK